MNIALQILEKRALGRLKQDKRSINTDNPYRERVPVYDKRTGKFIKYETQKRPIPKRLSPNDAKILKRVRKRAYRWDMAFGCCCCFGFRFGWSAIVGLLPVVGDFVDFFMALTLIKTASKVDGGLPKILYGMMMANILWDLALGFIPVLGDLADMWNKANTRNAWLLDAYLTEKAEALENCKIKDPDNGRIVPIPSELKVSPGDEEMEVGVEPVKAVEPTPMTPARHAPTSKGNMAAAPQRPITPGRNLTGGRPPRRDPRD